MPRTTYYGHKNGPVTIQPNIGLDAAARQSVVEILNLLLADEAVLALKTRRADEQAGATGLSDLQAFYADQSQQIDAIALEIAERVQILGGLPLNGADSLIDSARLGGDSSPVSGIVSLLANHEAFIRFLREDAQKCSEAFEDQGTFALLVRVMRQHEKMAWILRSNMGLGQLEDEK